MTGRLVWFAAGVGLGVAATRRLARVTEGSAVADVAARAAGGLASRVRRVVDDAIADGRIEMHQREARLREVLAAPGDHRAAAAGGRR
jgi:hypothetical protein